MSRSSNGQVAMLEIRRVVERVHEDRSACAREAQGEDVAVVCLAAFQEIEWGFAEREGVAEHGQAARDDRGSLRQAYEVSCKERAAYPPACDCRRW